MNIYILKRKRKREKKEMKQQMASFFPSLERLKRKHRFFHICYCFFQLVLLEVSNQRLTIITVANYVH